MGQNYRPLKHIQIWEPFDSIRVAPYQWFRNIVPSFDMEISVLGGTFYVLKYDAYC